MKVYKIIYSRSSMPILFQYSTIYYNFADRSICSRKIIIQYFTCWLLRAYFSLKLIMKQLKLNRGPVGQYKYMLIHL